MPAPGRYPYKKLAYYPRLRPEDASVWETFIELFPDKKWEMDYDVKVGLGRAPLKELQAKYKKDWRDLTRKRIDAVAWGPDDIFIIELKPRAGLSAIGQVLGYLELWQNLQNNGRTVRPTIICHSTDPDTATVARKAGVEIILVPNLSKP